MLRTQIDPFTVEILRSGIVATTQEMKVNLMRTAYNAIVYESEDFTVAVTDRDGNLASIGLGLPSFIRGISDTVKAMIKFFDGDIHPGDILLTNDAVYHGSHLNHVIMALPVFVDGEIVAFACSEPHWAEIGGVIGAPTTDIYSEGLQIPPVKIYNKGVFNKELMSIVQLNVRNPELMMGDFRGQVACCKTGEKRLIHMATKYGKETFIRGLEVIMDQSEQFSRSQLRKIPDGSWEAEQFLDDDGIEVGKHMVIKVKITKKGDEMTVDLTGIGPQVRGPYNSGAAVSGAQMGFKTLICSTWYPVNDGSFRPLKVITKPGTFATAQRPSGLTRWMIPPMNIADTMWKAIAPAMPELVAAGHFATLGANIGPGTPIDPKSGRPIAARRGLGANGGGGWGAKFDSDGNCAVYCLNDGDTHNTPVEAGEAVNYNRGMILSMELVQDSGGPGKFRGGVGSTSVAVTFVDSMMNTQMDRTMCPPWGAFGGKPGMANGLRLEIPVDRLSEEDVKSAKVLSVPVKSESYPNAERPNGKVHKVIPRGSRSQGISGGGGGFGNPFERDVWRVEWDVLNEYVSIEAARREYGVVIDPKTLKADEPATRALRASKK